jgi:hypothetical protein
MDRKRVRERGGGTMVSFIEEIHPDTQLLEVDLCPNNI